jgi:hypothetical protein
MFTIKGDKSLCIISNDGKLALFIETIDPELKMYDYYTDSKSIEEAKKKITDEFGFYDERLCYVEKYYKERFKKEKKLEYMTK